VSFESELQAQRVSFESELQTQRAETAKLKKELEIQKAETAELKKELEIQKTKYEASQRRNLELESVIRNLRGQLKTQRARTARLSNELKKQKYENRLLLKKVSDLEEMLSQKSHEFDTFRQSLDNKILMRDCISEIIESLILNFTSSNQVQEDETNSWDVLQDYFSKNTALRGDFNSFLGEFSLGIHEFEKLLYIKKKLNKAFHTVNVPEPISMDMSGTGLSHNESSCLKKFAAAYKRLMQDQTIC
jgi:uncharacterized phage infection (PIP) family protein YhgE